MADRVALVTGAAGGIGAAVVVRLLADGWAIVRADLENPTAPASGGVRIHAGYETRAYFGNLSTDAGAQGAVRVALDEWGRLDLLVNNAGGGVLRPFMEHDEASIGETIQRNLLTTIHCCHAAIPALKEHRGRIVNIGADSVRTGLALHAMYNAAKGGVHGLTTGLARELALDGVTVNCVAPSIIATEAVQEMLAESGRFDAAWQAMLKQAVDIIPTGRPGTVEEVAAAVAFLASEEASFITGQVISVNGGSSML